MSFKAEIEKLIEDNLKTYRDKSNRFIADYNRELELTKEYNGRQLLELLQNADDAGSYEVLIKWNKDHNILAISNQGEPFDSTGIESLMVANLSTKTKLSYIGNKGLGFRSILNWAERVDINTNQCTVSFSPEIAKDVFEKTLGLSETQKKHLRETRNLSANSIPFPILGIPKVGAREDQDDWTTVINIKYKKDYEEDIEGQIKDIREEILLFLNNIRKITIQTNEETFEFLSKKELHDQFDYISIGSKSWKVFKREDFLPEEYQDATKNERQLFNLRVAFQDDLSDTYHKLFSYFPTQISITLPCIIHGTFELNSSRNHINDSKRNEYILGELVELFKKCSLYLTTQNVGWNPLRLISPVSPISDSKLIEGFYTKLREIKNTETIYPCINGNYNPLNNAIYYSEEFNGFFRKHFPSTLPELIIPINDEVEDRFENDKYNHDFLVEKIDALSLQEMDVTLRAELIVQLAHAIPSGEDHERFSLLINESNKVISKNDLAFTPAIRAEESFSIPTSVRVDFMSPELFDSLSSKLESKFEKGEPKARELQRAIKSVVNLQPYDSNNVVDKIITGTKEAVRVLDGIKDQIGRIKEMISALYFNFANIENRQDKLKVSVPLITKANTIANADDLFLSETFPSGAITEEIYEDVFTSEDYVAAISFWNMEIYDVNKVEEFFLWLGVNKHSKLLPLNLHQNWGEENFVEFLFTNGTEKPDDFEIKRIQRDSVVSKLDRFEQIRTLSINKVILLVAKDVSIRRLIESNDEKLSWYYVTSRPTISTSFSYVRYQFYRSGIFTKLVFEDGGEELHRLINDNLKIDYEYLGRFNIEASEIRYLLSKLGAKESFAELSPEYIYEILNSVPAKDKNVEGTATQSLYKMALESLVKQESTFPVPQNIKYYSRKGDSNKYRFKEEVYYSDNTILPKKILSTLPLLNLPKRVGEDNVQKYFGVRSLKDFRIQIREDSLNFSLCNVEFSRWFETIKPFILAYRLNSSSLRRPINDSEAKRKEAKTLKQCKIHIVTRCLFRFGEKEEFEVEEKEFINSKEDFYFRDSIIRSVDGLKRDSLFCDAFAEMMCIIFKVNDLKNDFRQILKNDFQDNMHLACTDLLKEKIDEAYQLLGVPRREIEFWSNVFSIEGKQLKEPIESIEDLKRKVSEGLSINLSDNYDQVDFENFANRNSYDLILLLCTSLKIDVRLLVPTGLSKWYKNELVTALKNQEDKFKQLLWKKLNVLPLEQPNFISDLNRYNFSLLDTADSLTSEYEYELNVDIGEVLRKSVKEIFEIDLNNDFSERIDIRNLYIDLLQNGNIEETDIAEESIRSLLFFSGNEQSIKEYLEQIISEDESVNNGEDESVGSLIEVSASKSEKMFHVDTGNAGSPWLHSNFGDKGKKRKGKRSERIVYNTLVQTYGIENVKWVSGNSTTPDKNDRLHYDIEYKNEDGQWKYVEVKSITDNQFVISTPEKNHGLQDPDNYEMALVNEKSIYIVKDMFKFAGGETFENNSKFAAYPKDFIFVFDLSTINTQN